MKLLQQINLGALNEVAGDSINDLAIDLIDDMMDALPDEDPKSKIYQHILNILQKV